MQAAKNTLSNAQLGMLVAIGSWTMLFGTLILSYLLARTRASVWPPIGSSRMPILLPTLSTLAIVASSLGVHQSFQALVRNKKLQSFKKSWSIALGFALAFTTLQVLTWFKLLALGLKASQGLYASIIYTMIGFHGIHVACALGLLGWVWARPGTAPNYERTRLVGWFWHFLGGIWLILYFCLVWF
jgi:cytochrome c oxidase subunit 3